MRLRLSLLMWLVGVCFSLPIFAVENKQEKRFAPVPLRSNISPARGVFGIALGGLKPFGGEGQLFLPNGDRPHGDYGLIGGVDYWKRNLNSFDYHLGVLVKYTQYHFHHMDEAQGELTGYFRMINYSLPFSLHFKIPSYPSLQAIGGFAITSQNTMGTQRGTTGDFSYRTSLKLQWTAVPELFLGINFLEEKTDFLFFRGSIIYSSFPFRNLSYEALFGNNTQEYAAARRMGSGKVELLITIYPKWKFKKSFGNDEGINCPTAF